MRDDDRERLARDLRRWAERPPRLSAQAARTRVVARLADRRRRPSWLLTAGATVAASVLALVLVIARRDEPMDATPAARVAPQRTIVHQLSSGTKLYIVMRPGAPGDRP